MLIFIFLLSGFYRKIPLFYAYFRNLYGIICYPLQTQQCYLLSLLEKLYMVCVICRHWSYGEDTVQVIRSNNSIDLHSIHILVLQKVNLVADIGGQLGLWIGISVLTCCEFLELILLIIRSLIKRSFSRNIINVEPSPR